MEPSAHARRPALGGGAFRMSKIPAYGWRRPCPRIRPGVGTHNTWERLAAPLRDAAQDRQGHPDRTAQKAPHCGAPRHLKHAYVWGAAQSPTGGAPRLAWSAPRKAADARHGNARATGIDHPGAGTIEMRTAVVWRMGELHADNQCRLWPSVVGEVATGRQREESPAGFRRRQPGPGWGCCRTIRNGSGNRPAPLAPLWLGQLPPAHHAQQRGACGPPKQNCEFVGDNVRAGIHDGSGLAHGCALHRGDSSPFSHCPGACSPGRPNGSTRSIAGIG